MFMEVPEKYDRFNRLLTFRLDELWRKKAVAEILNNNPSKILDLCTGTGDLINRIAKITKGKAELHALDYSKPMLAIAKKKTNPAFVINYHYGDAASQPFPDGYFDAVGISFAFRNLTYKNPDKDLFLREINRVLKSGGKFVIVETSQPSNKFMRLIFRNYMNIAVGKFGALVSGNKGAYRYLAHSAINYYSPVEIKTLLTNAGFAGFNSTGLFGGIAAVYSATKQLPEANENANIS